MAVDRLARRVHLHELPDTRVPARYSRGRKRRALELQRFLSALHAAAEQRLEVRRPVELVVLTAGDWRQVISYSYGFPFTRTVGGSVMVVAAGDYPIRMLERFERLALRATQAGERPPGDGREFLDLLIGHEWGHAAANLAGLRTRVKWIDELLASYLFLAALSEQGMTEMSDRFLAWARASIAGSAVRRADLGSFEYPRARLKFDDVLWFQGVFTVRAAEVLAARGWDFPLALKGALGSRSRGDVARALVEVEPSFVSWFKVFTTSDRMVPPET